MNARRLVFTTIALTAVLILGGCEVLGAVLSKTDAAKVDAKYKMPKRLTLVLAESYGNSGGIEVDAGRLTSTLLKAFKDNDIAPTVSQEDLDRLRDKDPEAYSKMTIDAIGRALGAKQVVYIHILRAEVEIPTSSQSIHGVMNARVHIVDSGTGETLWPTEERDGLLLQTDTPWVENTPQAQEQTRIDMANLMADGISKLFYDWAPDSDIKYHEATTPEQ